MHKDVAISQTMHYRPIVTGVTRDQVLYLPCNRHLSVQALIVERDNISVKQSNVKLLHVH